MKRFERRLDIKLELMLMYPMKKVTKSIIGARIIKVGRGQLLSLGRMDSMFWCVTEVLFIEFTPAIC